MTRRFRLVCMTATVLVASATMTASGQLASPQASKSAPSSTVVKKPVAKKTSSTQRVESNNFIYNSSSEDDSKVNSFNSAPKHFLLDQKAMWTSPARVRLPEATWLVPLGGFAAGLFATDTEVSRHLNNAPDTLHRYQQFSNYGVGTMVGAAAGSYILGLTTHNEHQRETGFLSGEAAIDSLVAVEALKYVTGRERPGTDNANGSFWRGGDSFPSEHAATAWAIAGIVAHEYPGPLPKIAAYGLASAISAARVTGREHFPSDALAGSAIGWLVSEYVYRDHHNPDLAGGGWEELGVRPERPSHWEPKFMGSPYVPLDSWVYPALLRLVALGYIKTDMEGMRPWTRMECARLVEEAADQIGESQSTGNEPSQLYDALEKEFGKEIDLLGGGNNRDAALESVYTRATKISGQPLTDGYHFGQTIINDDGRPYEEGFNNITGFSGWATDGPFIGYVQGEYQHAPSAPALPAPALQTIAQEDHLPASLIPPATPIPSTDRFQLLDSYVGMAFDNWQITFGRQSQWWGPDASGPMLFSTNAEPIDMLQINRVSPFKLPSILGVLGPIRGEFFLGQLTGQHLVLINGKGITGSYTTPLNPQPFLVGEKVNFKPTPNLEIGLGLTTITGGPGDPFTFKKFLEAIAPEGGGAAGTPNYFGNGHSEVDFTYRVPWLRNCLTLYADGFTGDEPSPVLGAWDKAAWTAGIYLPRISGIPKMDFRVEGLYSDPPMGGTVSRGFFYIGSSYPNGYTNSGNLMGSWVGRQGQGARAWTTYWFTPKDSLQFSFRHQKVSQQFVPFGGTLTDGGINANYWLRSMFSVSGLVQYEKWDFPVISPTRETNVSASVQFTFWPKFRDARGDAASQMGDAPYVR